VAARRNPDTGASRRRPRATTPEGRENQLIADAVDLAEKQIAAGTASSQVVTHFLKMGSSREKIEQRRIELENEFLVIKAEALASQKRVEELYGAALNAMRQYAGQEPLQLPEEDFDD
jgi:hypothetical protein